MPELNCSLDEELILMVEQEGSALVRECPTVAKSSSILCMLTTHLIAGRSSCPDSVPVAGLIISDDQRR